MKTSVTRPYPSRRPVLLRALVRGLTRGCAALGLLAAAGAQAATAAPENVPGLTAAPASADAEALTGEADGWQFSGGPYLWAAGIRGNVGHQSTGTAFMKSNFHDIARDLDVAVMGMGRPVRDRSACWRTSCSLTPPPKPACPRGRLPAG